MTCRLQHKGTQASFEGFVMARNQHVAALGQRDRLLIFEIQNVSGRLIVSFESMMLNTNRKETQSHAATGCRRRWQRPANIRLQAKAGGPQLCHVAIGLQATRFWI